MYSNWIKWSFYYVRSPVRITIILDHLVTMLDHHVGFLHVESPCWSDAVRKRLFCFVPESVSSERGCWQRRRSSMKRVKCSATNILTTASIRCTVRTWQSRNSTIPPIQTASTSGTTKLGSNREFQGWAAENSWVRVLIWHTTSSIHLKILM